MRGIHLNMLSPMRIHEAKESHEPVESLQRLSAADSGDNNTDLQLQPRSKDKDEVDRPHKSATVTRWDVIFLSFSIITHIFDIGADIYLATSYYIGNKIVYFSWTIAFMIFPTFVNTFISFRMNDNDLQVGMKNVDENGRNKSIRTATTTVAQRKECCILVLLFQLGPVLRYLDSLRYALMARRCKRRGDREGQQRYYLKMLKEDQDVALLRVFECFLESAPQQILQLTILLMIKKQNSDKQDSDKPESNTESVVALQLLSVCSSLVSMGWSMASYHRAIRLAQHDKPNISLIGTVLQFVWHFCVTVSRILSISVLASKSPLYTALACVLHWTAMTTWLITEPHGVADFCRDVENPPYTPLTLRERFRSALFAAVLGIVYIFTYLNPSEGRTFIRHLFYYALCLTENTAAAVLWAMYADEASKQKWYFKFLITLCTVPFCVGIAAMILYYMFFHPTTKRKRSPPPPPPPEPVSAPS